MPREFVMKMGVAPSRSKKADDNGVDPIGVYDGRSTLDLGAGRESGRSGFAGPRTGQATVDRAPVPEPIRAPLDVTAEVVAPTRPMIHLAMSEMSANDDMGVSAYLRAKRALQQRRFTAAGIQRDNDSFELAAFDPLKDVRQHPQMRRGLKSGVHEPGKVEQ